MLSSLQDGQPHDWDAASSYGGSSARRAPRSASSWHGQSDEGGPTVCRADAADQPRAGGSAEEPVPGQHGQGGRRWLRRRGRLS